MNKMIKYASIFAPFINGFIHEKELRGYKATQLNGRCMSLIDSLRKLPKRIFLSATGI